VVHLEAGEREREKAVLGVRAVKAGPVHQKNCPITHTNSDDELLMISERERERERGFISSSIY
jgi:hypothetical protein